MNTTPAVALLLMGAAAGLGMLCTYAVAERMWPVAFLNLWAAFAVAVVAVREWDR